MAGQSVKLKDETMVSLHTWLNCKEEEIVNNADENLLVLM